MLILVFPRDLIRCIVNLRYVSVDPSYTRDTVRGKSGEICPVNDMTIMKTSGGTSVHILVA
jgi:hypothetical protein